LRLSTRKKKSSKTQYANSLIDYFSRKFPVDQAALTEQLNSKICTNGIFEKDWQRTVLIEALNVLYFFTRYNQYIEVAEVINQSILNIYPVYDNETGEKKQGWAVAGVKE
jgi:hypothetical protein